MSFFETQEFSKLCKMAQETYLKKQEPDAAM